MRKVDACIFPATTRCPICDTRQWIRATPFGLSIACYAGHAQREIASKKTFLAADFPESVRQIRTIDLPLSAP